MWHRRLAGVQKCFDTGGTPVPRCVDTPLRRFYISAMSPRPGLPFAIIAIILLAGCDSTPADKSAPVNMFAPTGMRIHPIFTQVELDKDGKPTGIEAQLEFQDQFGDPTKASGRVLFELFNYRQDSPDPRGKRVGGPWVGSLASLDEQHDRWNTTLRTYRFELNDPIIHLDEPYVLTAIFELTGGGRFFDRSILPGIKSESKTQEPSGIFH
jgi:hypothetical protein